MDWGDAGSVSVGDTRRRLWIFVVLLGYSRLMNLEFTRCQQAAYFPARHYSFEPRACNERSPVRQVERAVGYICGSLLNGQDSGAFQPLNPIARSWLE